MLRLPPIPTDTDTLFPSTKRFRSKLPDEVRSRYDTSTLKVAIHAAAPCPVPVKQAMIDWWGPVHFEYYAGSEGNGMTFISSADRSEEHTSELQSLMSNSYAVFCLKTQKLKYIIKVYITTLYT